MIDLRDPAECARLRERFDKYEPCGESCDCCPCSAVATALAALALIEQQAAEIERLRESLAVCGNRYGSYPVRAAKEAIDG